MTYKTVSLSSHLEAPFYGRTYHRLILLGKPPTARGETGRLLVVVERTKFLIRRTPTARDTPLTPISAAGPVLLPTHPYPAGDMSIANGHSPDMDDNVMQPSPQIPRSESDLSDLNDLPTAPLSSVSSPDNADPSDDDAIHDMATSEIEDDDEDAEGEEDADFDEETPAPEAADGMRHDRSASEESSRPDKQNTDVDDEEYMKQNPELYGLRRSVRIVVKLVLGSC